MSRNNTVKSTEETKFDDAFRVGDDDICCRLD